MDFQFKLLFTNQEAAELLSVSPRHLFDLVRRGEIKSIKSGNRNLFPKESLIGWIESKLSKPSNS
jgi:excisionase family DNA binding protein